MMNAPQQAVNLSALATAKQLAEQFAQTAAERDKAGGNPKLERDLIRHIVVAYWDCLFHNNMAGKEQTGKQFSRPFKVLHKLIVP